MESIYIVDTDFHPVSASQGRNRVSLRGGSEGIYIHNRKDEIIHGRNVKCVEPLFRDMSLAKV